MLSSAYEFIISNKIIEYFKTGNFYLDCLIGSIVCGIFSFLCNIRYNIYLDRIKQYFNSESHKSSLFFEYKKSKLSKTFKAILFYIDNHQIENISHLKEEREIYYEYDDGKRKDEYMYLPSNEHSYKLSKDIFIKVSYKEKKVESGNYERYEEYNSMLLYSDKLNIVDLKKFSKEACDEYDRYLSDTLLKNQCLLTCSYDFENKSLNVSKVKFTSNRKFDNFFFEKKDLLIRKVDKFLTGEKWYNDRGIPYNLGLLLYGDPGCGKTSFIKALLKYVDERSSSRVHGIYVNLTDKFDLDELEKLITNEVIGDYEIPLSNRIYIFEDIDCMGDVVKDRDLKDISDKKLIDELSKVLTDSNNGSKKIDSNIGKCNYDNSLSKILNIFDGLIEAPGRITIFTTNKLEMLDKALTRPGRVDMKINFTKCSKNMALDIINNFYSCNISIEDFYNFEEYKITPAELIQLCFEHQNYESLLDNFNSMTNKDN